MGKPHAYVDRLESRTHFAAGDADLTFAPRGWRALDADAYAVYSQFVRLPDGGHLLTSARQFTQYGGYYDDYDGSYVPVSYDDSPYDVMRLKPDGTTDTTYGTAGHADSPLDKIAYARVNGDGGVMLFGYAGDKYGELTVGTPTVVKLDAAGRLDRRFGTKGRITIDATVLPATTVVLGTRLSEDGRLTVLLDPDGSYMTYGRPYVRRFDTRGAVDKAFGVKGRAELNAGGRRIDSATLAGTGEKDDPLYIGGVVLNRAGTTSYGGGVLKLTSGGAPDTDFGRKGIAVSDAAPSDSIALDAEGRPVLSGTDVQTKYVFDGTNSYNVETYTALLARFTTAGQPDAAFGRNGIARAPTGVGGGGELHFAPDGSMIDAAAGGVLRFNAKGRYDKAFGNVRVDGQFFDTADPQRILVLDDNKLQAIQADDDMPPGPFFVKNRTLYFNGTRKNDSFGLFEEWDDQNDPTTYSEVVYANNIGRAYPAGTFRRVIVNGNDGDDSIGITASFSRGVYVHGGEGNDRIAVDARIAFLYGDAGRDKISLDTESGHPAAGGALIDGGSGSDVLSGNEYADTIFAGSGNDAIYAHEGNDLIYGGPGADRIYSSTGRDTIDGGTGDDWGDWDDDDRPVSVERRE